MPDNSKFTVKQYSGKQVIHAGERLLLDSVLNNRAEFEKAMDILSYWRFTHELPLEEAFKVLQEVSLLVDQSAIFAKRLKRYASIMYKLKRFKEMKLKNMQRARDWLAQHLQS